MPNKNEPIKLKYPILNNVDYMDITKNKNQIKAFSGSEINGLKWREVCFLIGKIAGQGSYRYSLKFKNEPIINNGMIRGIVAQSELQENKNDSHLKNEIEKLTNKVENLNKSNSSGIGFEMLLEITKQSYLTQIDFLKQQLQVKDVSISKLELQIEKLNDELDQCYQTIEDNASKSGIASYIDLAKDFLKLKLPGEIKPVSLKDSNANDIPKQITDILGVVNWSLVDDNVINEIVKYLNLFIPKLPLKS